ncbi:MAG: hypothetical protein GEV09_26625, partial [Pseudonocardiaceae bacterium]|nr:hypothetical protein [Pseudonocardiaceae bacterium]
MVQSLVELFRNELSLSADLLAGVFSVPVPAYRAARLGDPVIKDITPTERRSDAVVVFADADDDPVLGVIVEVQLTWDEDKEWVWPAYPATLRARLHCPVMLLVISPTGAVATRCAVPIHLGHPGLVLTPLVLGPDQIPVITDPAQGAAAPRTRRAVRHHPQPRPRVRGDPARPGQRARSQRTRRRV